MRCRCSSLAVELSRPVPRSMFISANHWLIREVVKTTLHARDPLLRGEGREETMGLPGEVGG